MHNSRGIVIIYNIKIFDDIKDLNAIAMDYTSLDVLRSIKTINMQIFGKYFTVVPQ